ncbi:MAG: ATP-binding cassette domain-containing protein [Pararobbsia sp.]
MNLPRPLRGLAALLALYLVAPLLTVIPQLVQADWSALRQRALWQATEVSFASASLATCVIGLGGIPLGYYLARRTSLASRVLGFVVQLPLALPPLVAGVLLLFLFGPYTLLGRWAVAAGLPLTDSFAGVVCAEVFVAAPFLIVAARSAFVSVDRELEHVAATLGHRPAARFFKVSLPLAWPTILAGLLLAWLRAIGEFGATVMVAYHPYSLPVFTFVSFGSQGLSAMLPILLPTLLSALVVVAAATVLRRRHARAASDGRAARRIRSLAETPAGEAAAVRPAPDPELELDLRLRHRYRNFALDLALQTRARRIAILGPSGSGKSLSLRLLAGLEMGAGTTVTIDGARIETQLPEARRIGYVPQNYALFPHLPVAEQLLFAPDAVPGLAAYWAQRFGLLPLLERLPAQLSLGQQQRVALARALARPSRLLLLDEPFAALDTPLRTRLRRALRTLQRDFEGTTVIVTHDPQDAAELADEIVVMDAGSRASAWAGAYRVPAARIGGDRRPARRRECVRCADRRGRQCRGARAGRRGAQDRRARYGLAGRYALPREDSRAGDPARCGWRLRGRRRGSLRDAQSRARRVARRRVVTRLGRGGRRRRCRALFDRCIPGRGLGE